MRWEQPIVQKVGIVRDKNAVLAPCRSKHIFIATPGKPDIRDVFRVVALMSKNLGNAFSHTLVY